MIIDTSMFLLNTQKLMKMIYSLKLPFTTVGLKQLISTCFLLCGIAILGHGAMTIINQRCFSMMTAILKLSIAILEIFILRQMENLKRYFARMKRTVNVYTISLAKAPAKTVSMTS